MKEMQVLKVTALHLPMPLMVVYTLALSMTTTQLVSFQKKNDYVTIALIRISC